MAGEFTEQPASVCLWQRIQSVDATPPGLYSKLRRCIHRLNSLPKAGIEWGAVCIRNLAMVGQHFTSNWRLKAAQHSRITITACLLVSLLNFGTCYGANTDEIPLHQSGSAPPPPTDAPSITPSKESSNAAMSSDRETLTGDHDDPQFRAEVLSSIQRLELSLQYANRVPRLYAEAIEKWAAPDRESHQIQACDGLYVWYWVLPYFPRPSRNSFQKCPVHWQETVLEAEDLPARIVNDPHLPDRLAIACSFALVYELQLRAAIRAKQFGSAIALRGRRIGLRTPVAAEDFARCPQDWRDVYVSPNDRRYIPLVKTNADFPDKAFRVCEDGWVILRFKIDRDGLAKSIRVEESSHRMYRRPAIDALRKFVYLPSQSNGEYVVTKNVRLKFTFDVDCS